MRLKHRHSSVKMDISWIVLIILNCMHSSSGETVPYLCNFEVGCNFVTDMEGQITWILNSGPTLSSGTGPDGDHTTGSGSYLYMESTDTNPGDYAITLSPTLSGTGNVCSTISFYYNMFGDDIGSLNLYLVKGQPPYIYDNPLWSVVGDQGKTWLGMDINITFPADFKLVFQGITRRSLLDNKGDIAIDDIFVETGKCDYAPCDSSIPWCKNGGTCVNVANNSESYSVCECAPGWEGPHCESDVDECADNPCLNGATCTHGLNTYECFCDIGYHGTHCEFVDQCISPDIHRCMNGGTCHVAGNDFTCACAPGYTGTICDVEINECDTNPCAHGTCNDLINDYSCTCLPDWVGYNCDTPPGGCQFDHGYEACNYTTIPVIDYTWAANTGSTPNFGTGPDNDHTTGNGMYMYADAKDQRVPDRALLYSPVLAKSAVGACTRIRFWYWMSGNTVGTLNMYVSGTGNSDLETNPALSIQGDQGEAWIQATVDVSSSVPYSITFEARAATSATYRGDIAIDDVVIEPNTCAFQPCSEIPCRNGGTCFEVSSQQGDYVCSCTDLWTGPTCEVDTNLCTSNPCLNGGTCQDLYQSYHCLCDDLHIGLQCEDVMGSCNFESTSNPTCSYDNDNSANFFWKHWSGSTPSAQTGPSSDHTTGDLGFYLYAEATDRVGGDKARVMTPFVPGSGGSCTQLSFWFFTNGANVGQLAVHIEFAGQPLANPIWTKVGGDKNGWTNIKLNISVPTDFRVVFEAVMESNALVDLDNRGDIAIDDVQVFPNVGCSYESCFLQPCKNGGTCISETETNFKCLCTDDYAGATCEVYSQCEPTNPCLSGGVCEIGGDGNFQCLCENGFTGPTCNIKDLCYSFPCQNGATCTVGEATYVCACADGYEGKECQTDIDECLSKPCLNGGTCVDGINGYICNCLASSHGNNCEKLTASCDFEEQSLCDWSPDPKSDYNWMIQSGTSTNYPLSGPRYDHTYQSRDLGYYLSTLIYMYDPPDGALYRFRSPQVVVSEYGNNVFNIELYYHMFGDGIGTFNVYVEESGQQENRIHQVVGQQSRDWIFYGHTLTTDNNWTLIIEHEVKKTLLYMGDLAVDDVKITLQQPDTTATTQLTRTTQRIDTSQTTPSMRATTAANTAIPTSETDMASDGANTTHSPGTDGDTGSGGGSVDGGVIAGAVIGALLGVVLIAGLVYFFVSRRETHQPQSRTKLSGVENPSYNL